MKVSELIEKLKDFDADAEVHFTYNYGDHWRTQVAQSAIDVFEGYVTYSAYHRMDTLLEDYNGPEDDDDDRVVRNVVIIQ
jgi:hypothetical protein